MLGTDAMLQASLKRIARPFPAFTGVALAAFLFAITIGVPLAHIEVCVFNNRSDKIYSAAFTFFCAYWTAFVTVWALLKTRATRYIERLADNVVYREFLAQLERRLLYALCVLLLTFVMFVFDIKITGDHDPASIAVATWGLLFTVSSASLLDCLYTARVVLD